jgi:hypothetical protein
MVGQSQLMFITQWLTTFFSVFFPTPGLGPLRHTHSHNQGGRRKRGGVVSNNRAPALRRERAGRAPTGRPDCAPPPPPSTTPWGRWSRLLSLGYPYAHLLVITPPSSSCYQLQRHLMGAASRAGTCPGWLIMHRSTRCFLPSILAQLPSQVHGASGMLVHSLMRLATVPPVLVLAVVRAHVCHVWQVCDVVAYSGQPGVLYPAPLGLEVVQH